MQALILAGGGGSRMTEITAHLPKPLLYLPGGTLLEYQLALLAQLPLSHAFVLIHHRAEQMKQALRDYENLTALQQRPPFTMLGALASADGNLSEPFVVLHADNYFSHGLDYLLQEAQTAASGLKPDAVFLIDRRVHHSDRARRLASTGCYILSLDILPIVKRLRVRDQLSCLTDALLEYGAVVKEVPLQGWRANINHLRDLLCVSGRILEDWSGSFHPLGAEEGYDRAEGCLKAERPLWISRASEVFDSHLGPRVVVGPQARVRNCALREVTVFPRAEIVGQQLAHGVVLPGTTGFVPLTP